VLLPVPLPLPLPLRLRRPLPLQLPPPFRVTDDQKDILAKAAERAGLGLNSWLLMLGLREAGADK
jgi:hypothetical protein